MAGSLLPQPKQQFFDDDGKPLVGGFVETYAAGTLDKKATYQDVELLTANENPVELNARGEGTIYGTGTYRVILKRKNGTVVWDRDNVEVGVSAGLVTLDGVSLDAFTKDRLPRVISSIGDLRSINKAKYTKVLVTGYYADGDGGGGLYYYDSADTTSADNGGTVIVATDGGRWKLIYQDVISVKQYGAKGDGVADDTSSIQAACDAFDTVYFPPGIYKHTTIKQKRDYLHIIGAGRGATVLKCVAGIGLKNFDGADSDAAAYRGLAIHDLTFEGGYINPDDFSAPANAWALESGRDKGLTTVGINGALYIKRADKLIVERVRFKNFHRHVQIAAGIDSTFRDNEFINGQVGFYCENGASWGDASYKTTSFRIEANRFAELWFGAYAKEMVDNCEWLNNVFEPCNTAQYFFNGGSERGTNTVSDYYERCYEGIVFDGGFLSNWRIVDPYFAGSPGNFWGYGYSINVLASASANARIRIDADALGGGGVAQQSNGRIIARNLRAVGGYFCKNLYLDDFVNKPIYPDPLLTRHGRLIDYGAGITGKTVESDSVDGSIVLAFVGSNTGLAFNGLRLLYSGTRDKPLRIRYSYQYTGSTTNFTPFGVFFGAPYNGFVGPMVTGDTGGEWVDVDMAFDEAGVVDYGNANAQGGFQGTLKIKHLFISEGYGAAENYPVNPALIPDQLSPFTGRAFVADRAPNQSPAVGQPKAWLCTASGTPGTWVSEGNL